MGELEEQLKPFIIQFNISPKARLFNTFMPQLKAHGVIVNLCHLHFEEYLLCLVLIPI